MAQFTHEGVVYEELPNGQVRVVGYAGAQQQAPKPVTIGTPDPTQPLDMRIKAGQIDKQGRDAAADAVALRLKELELAEATRKAKAEEGKGRSVTAIQDEARRFINLAEDLKKKSREGWFATGFGQTPAALISGTPAYDVAQNVQTIQGGTALEKLAELRASSPAGGNPFGQMSNADMELLKASVAALDPGQSDTQFQANMDYIIGQYQKLLPENERPKEGERPPAIGAGSTATQRGAVPPSMGGPSPELAGGGFQIVDDPAKRGVSAQVSRMVKDRATAGEIYRYLQQVGINPNDVQGIEAAVEFRRRNPQYKGDFSVDVGKMAVPLSAGQQVLNAVGQSPVGAYGINAADALTLGNLDSMTANPELTRTLMRQVSEDNPLSSLGGQLTGGTLGVLGAGRALGAAARGTGALSSALRNPLTAETLYGAGYGAGQSDDGNRLAGALLGATAGYAGGRLGDRVARGIGSGLTGVTDEGVRYLADRGVRLTPGQMAGGAFKSAEDRMTGFTGLGDRIQELRRRGMGDWNREAFEQGMAPTGTVVPNQPIGELGSEVAGQRSRDAYTAALSGGDLTPDQQFIQEYGAAVARGDQVPDLGETVRYTMVEEPGAILDPFNAGGGSPTIPAEAFQDLDRLLANREAAFRKQYSSGQAVLGDKAADALGEGADALTGLFGRQYPENLARYQGAKQGYRNLQILNDAVIAARNNGGMFTPAQLGNAAITNTKKFGGKAQAASTERPFFELQRYGQDVLPSKVPDSGTAGRMREGSIVRQLAGAAKDKLISPIYSDAAQPVIQAMLLSRPDVVRNIGKKVKDKARVGGIFGAPLLLQAPTY